MVQVTPRLRVGLYKSTDFGKSWTLVPGSVAATAPCASGTGSCPVAVGRSIGAIAVDPANPNHIFIGTDVARHGSSSVNGGRFTPPGAAQVGLYESTDGGATFSAAFILAQDTVNPGNPTAATLPPRVHQISSSTGHLVRRRFTLRSSPMACSDARRRLMAIHPSIRSLCRQAADHLPSRHLRGPSSRSLQRAAACASTLATQAMRRRISITLTTQTLQRQHCSAVARTVAGQSCLILQTAHQGLPNITTAARNVHTICRSTLHQGHLTLST